MTSFEVTVDLFDVESELMPTARVRALDFLEHAKCTCSAIVQRQLGSGIWNDKFTQTILCRNSTSLECTLRALKQHESLTTYPTAPTESERHAKHLEILLAMKSTCECLSWYESTTFHASSNNTTESWGLLDANLSHHPLSSNKLNFDRVLRACPMALRLYALPTRSALHTKLNQDLTRTVKTKLKPREDEDKFGYCYIMQRDSLPGYVKIGFTKKHVAIRHDSLQKCFGDVRLVGHTNKVLNARKLERLAHTELTYYRRWQDCGKCGTGHQEWFEVGAEVAKAVVLRWARWLACEPYDRRSGALTTYWMETVAGDHTQNIVAALQEVLGGMELGGPSKQLVRVENVRMIVPEGDAGCWSSPQDSDTLMAD